MFTFYFQKDQTRKSNRNSICSTFPCKQIDVPANQLLILQHGENGGFIHEYLLQITTYYPSLLINENYRPDFCK